MGIYNQTDINRVIKGTTFWTDNKKYVFVKLDRADYARLTTQLSHYSNEYVEVINDKSELTLIILKQTWEQDFVSLFKPTAEVLPIAIISCDVKEPTVTGYLLHLLQALSPSNIGVYVQGAYTSDHIFVDFENLDKALNLLNELKEKI